MDLVSRIRKGSSNLYLIALFLVAYSIFDVMQDVSKFWVIYFEQAHSGLLQNIAISGRIVFPIMCLFLLLFKNKSVFWVLLIAFIPKLISLPMVIQRGPQQSIQNISVELVVLATLAVICWFLAKRGELK